MSLKIDPSEIVKDHFSSLVDYNTGRVGRNDWLSFLALPLLFAGVLYATGLRIDSSSVETVVASLAIFVGLLFNALVLLLDIIRKSAGERKKTEVVKQLISNISFSILVSILAVLVMLFAFIEDAPTWVIVTVNVLSFFLLIEFMVIFLMVLKRTYKIFQYDIEELKKRDRSDKALKTESKN